ncbi:HipA domain-containing protein [Metasolibacillus sp. FSL K6-0083]|uniref:HipA domain-containing protein n=1 Tax=Metasolibacillus sp. FSL K6-0083 TaxID=2921416 RepID=UPI00315ADDD1
MIDISRWERDIKSQASGTRTKFWLFEPNTNSEDNSKYLFKIPTKDTGGHWAEFIASKVGAQLGFTTVDVKLAKYNDDIGTISKNFRHKTEDLYEGGDLFLARFTDFNRHSLAYYELPYIMELLSEYDIEKEFVAIPIFDALIANNDRHCDNWGILSGPNGIRLAPIYDNGSSLGFNEVADRKQNMLTDDRMLAGFCNRGRPSIGLPNRKRPKHLELLTFLQNYLPNEFREVIMRLNCLNEDMLLTITKDIPVTVMKEQERKWVIRLLLYRKDWILNWYEGSVKV